MTKNKLTIDDIQKALLSNTHFIKEVEPEKPLEIIHVTPKVAKVEEPLNNNNVTIDPTTLKKFKILAKYMKIDHNELINSALKHYLTLKSMQLDQAMLKLTEEE